MPKIEQPIYKVIDSKFKLFVDSNWAWLSKMRHGIIVNLKDMSTSDLRCHNMLLPPFSVSHIGKYNADEGPIYVFLDNKFDKLYSYHDVE